MEEPQDVGVRLDEVPDLSIRTITAEFADPWNEDEFREAKAPVDARRLSTMLLFGGSLFPLFAVPDVIELGINRTTITIMAMEVAVALAATLHALRLRGDERRVLRFGAITAVELLAVATQLVVAWLKPEELQNLNLTFCVLVLALFAFIPNRFVNAVWVCASGLVAMVLITTIGYPPEYRADLKSIMALTTMTLVGAWIGNMLHRSRREEHASLLHERWSNQRLLAEITRREALEEELTWLADHDPLTDLLNRRAFFELADRELVRARRSNRPVSVLVIDADHFKSINDDYGHHTGDEAIKMIAGLCKVNLRSDDVVGRLGGEEFAVVMPSANLSLAWDVASRLRERIALHGIEHPEGTVAVTVSIGAVECRPWEESVQDAIQRADAAMYEAKAGGRNRVVAVSSV